MPFLQPKGNAKYALYYFFGGIVVVTTVVYSGFTLKLRFHSVEVLQPDLNGNSSYQARYCHDGDFSFDASSYLGSQLFGFIPLEVINNGTQVFKTGNNRTVKRRVKSAEETLSSPVTTTIVDTNVCRVYMAPSTIPGAGFGLFAGVPYQKGDLVTPGDGVVPIYDMEFHNGFSSNTFLWDEYVWSGSTFSAMSEFERSIDAASFGIGALPNCFFPLLNVEDSEDHGRDYANLDVATSPGIGAFSPWYDRKSYATQNIVAGSELFVDYGYEYFKSREETYGLIPFLEHYKEADRLLKRFVSLFENQDSFSRVNVMEDLFQLSRNALVEWSSRVYHALPNNTASIPQLLNNGGTSRKDYQRSVRNIDFLKNFGTCMDHLYVKPSVIPDAGRGVFTERSFRKGSVVTTVPLIHIQDRSVLSMFADSSLCVQQNGRSCDQRQPQHQQLLLNYCFGHNQSSLLLCPYGIVSSLINHAPTAKMIDDPNNKKSFAANLKIKWSASFTRYPEWFEMSLSEWAGQGNSGLSFEYIALRDIDIGEELMIDYGIDWQQAWNHHIFNWKPLKRKVDELNDANLIIPIESEWTWSTGDIIENPDAVNLWCYSVYRTMQGLEDIDSEKKAYPCKVVNRKLKTASESVLYTAELIQRRQNIDNIFCDEIFDEVLWSLPRDAFVYGDVFDHDSIRHHLSPNAFRHDMRIPDNIMPDIWKNA